MELIGIWTWHDVAIRRIRSFGTGTEHEDMAEGGETEVWYNDKPVGIAGGQVGIDMGLLPPWPVSSIIDRPGPICIELTEFIGAWP